MAYEHRATGLFMMTGTPIQGEAPTPPAPVALFAFRRLHHLTPRQGVLVKPLSRVKFPSQARCPVKLRNNGRRFSPAKLHLVSSLLRPQ